MSEITLQYEQLKQYLEWVRKEGSAELPTRLSTIMRQHQQYRLAWLKSHCTGMIMELGTCYGYVLAYCGGQIGIDINEDSLTLARVLNPERSFYQADIRQLPFPDDHVDTVMLPDVLEHITWEDIPAVLAEAKRVAKEKILITIPDEKGRDAHCFKHRWICTAPKLRQLQSHLPGAKVEKRHGFVFLEYFKKSPARYVSVIEFGKPPRFRVPVCDAPTVAGESSNNHKQVDFYASRSNYIDHLKPIYEGFPAEHRGHFIVRPEALKYAASIGIAATIPMLSRRDRLWDGPLVIATPGGHLEGLRLHNRPVALLNHGAGQSWVDVNHVAYAGGRGRGYLALILEPGDHPAGRDRKVAPRTKIVVIGCPKMDKWYVRSPSPRHNPLVVVIGFHMDTRVNSESRSAFAHYQEALPGLAKWARTKGIQLLGAGHPYFWQTLKPLWDKLGIEAIADWDEILERADIYIRDQMSSLYEFASLDRPVVVLNAPWYRRNVEHGLRFWEYANVGVNCNDSDDLIPAIEKTIEDTPEQQELRHKAVQAVYKYTDGKATERAIAAIMELL